MWQLKKEASLNSKYPFQNNIENDRALKILLREDVEGVSKGVMWSFLCLKNYVAAVLERSCRTEEWSKMKTNQISWCIEG